MCRLTRRYREDLLELLDLGFIEVPQAEIAARPRLVLGQRLAPCVERAQAGDAHCQRLKRFAYRTKERLGHGRESVHGTTARPQQKQLDGGRDLAIAPEPLAYRGNVVLAQAGRLQDFELGQPARQVLHADEAHCEGHGDTLRGRNRESSRAPHPGKP